MEQLKQKLDFNFELINVNDLWSLYNFFNPDQRLKLIPESKEAIFEAYSDVENEGMRKLIYLSALVAFDCIKINILSQKPDGDLMHNNYIEFNKNIEFDKNILALSPIESRIVLYIISVMEENKEMLQSLFLKYSFIDFSEGYLIKESEYYNPLLYSEEINQAIIK